MSSYYYGSTFGGQRQQLPRYYGSTAPYAGTAQPPVYGSPLPNFGAPGYGTQPGTAGGFTATGPGEVTSAPATVTTPQAPARPDLSHLDYSNDPILGRIRALAEESIGQAQADATAARTRLVIGLGDPDLAEKLGLGGKVRGQAEGNTFGTFQELGRQLERRNVFDINRPLSDKANLFYSTERGRQLGLSGEQYMRDKSTATNAAQERLATIASQVTQARMAAQAQIMQAEQDAYSRALQQALYSVT